MGFSVIGLPSTPLGYWYNPNSPNMPRGWLKVSKSLISVSFVIWALGLRAP